MSELSDDYCLQCGAPVSIPYDVPGDQPFCDEDCMADWDMDNGL